MRIDAIAHQGAIRCRDRRARWASCCGRRTIGGTGVSIRRTDAIGGLGGLGRLGRVGVAAQAGTFKEMLLLSRGILCTDLLTIDTLDGETLGIANKPKTEGFVC